MLCFSEVQGKGELHRSGLQAVAVFLRMLAPWILDHLLPFMYRNPGTSAVSACQPPAVQKILPGYPNIKQSGLYNVSVLFCTTLVCCFFLTFPFSLGGVAAVLFVCTALSKATVRTGTGKIQVSVKLCLQRPVSMTSL